MATTLKYIYLGILFVVVLYALVNYKKIKEAGGKYLVLVLLLSLVVDLLGTAARWYKVNFSWGYNIFIILSFPIYFVILKDSLPTKIRAIIPYMTLGFLLLALANFFFFEGIKSFNFISLMIGAALMILLSLLFFKSRFDNLHENLLDSWQFWVATGLLMYFTGTLFYFGLIKYLNTLNLEWAVRLNSMLQLLNILLYTIFGIALLCLTRRQKLFQ